MKITNANSSTGASMCLKMFYDLLEGDIKKQASLESQPAAVKGEIVTTIIISLAAATIYDILKLAVTRTLSALTDDDYIVIDDKKFALKDFPDQDKFRKMFDGRK